MKAFINGIHIYFDVEGSQLVPNGPRMNEKPVCFVIHGGPGGDHTMYKPGLSPLTDLVQLVYIDNRGSGYSDRVDECTYTIEQNVDDVEELRKYLGLDKIVLLGQSYGGMICMRYAIKHPYSVLALILITTSPSYTFLDAGKKYLKYKGTPEQKELGEILWSGAFESNEQFRCFLQVFGPLYSRKYNPEVAKDALARKQLSFKALNMGFAGFLRTMDLRDDLHSISVPTLVIGGRYDWITPWQESQVIADLILKSKLKIMENSSHEVLVDEPKEIIDAIRDFLYTLG